MLEARTRVLGHDHPDTLTARANLAGTLQALGQLGQARTIQEQVLEASSRVLGHDHPDTLTAKGNLATARPRRTDRARTMEEQVLEARAGCSATTTPAP